MGTACVRWWEGQAAWKGPRDCVAGAGRSGVAVGSQPVWEVCVSFARWKLTGRRLARSPPSRTGHRVMFPFFAYTLRVYVLLIRCGAPAMMDYRPWLRRAEDFIRGLSALPGEWSTSVDVEPPLSKAAADELHKSLPFGLPSPLHDLYTTGSRSCRCTYYWSPDEAYLPLVEKVLPCQHSLDGGARFLPAAELNNAHASRADGPSDGTRQAMSSRGWPRRFSSRSNWMSNQCRQPVHACRRPGRFSSR